MTARANTTDSPEFAEASRATHKPFRTPVGLGVNELSVSLPSIPTIKAQVRRLSYADCRELAQRALNCRTGDEVRVLPSRPRTLTLQ